MNFAFRTDASLQIGTGHVMRCLTLADALCERDSEVIFLCRPHTGHMIETIRDRGYEVLELGDADGVSSEDLDHSSWLGTTQSVDVSQCAELINGKEIDWLIVDHYALDYRWEEQLRASTKQLMVIDDLADRKHDCDLLLDQNLVLELDTRYSGLIPSHCVTLLGPEYALLQEEYLALRHSVSPRLGPLKQILVYIGGSDSHGLNLKILKALAKTEFKDVSIHIVLGINTNIEATLQKQAFNRPLTFIHRQLPSLAHLMMEVDLMIGAGGTTAWERICLGLPSIVISVATNQVAVSETLSKLGIIEYLGMDESVSSEDISSSVQGFLANKDKLEVASSSAISIGTGVGFNTLCDKLLYE